ncbi:MAG: hypothetical protein HC774_04305 [Sphingomonadales bacterium]|nr:hypothetical protein [Sphingomonadales bacterium]
MAGEPLPELSLTEGWRAQHVLPELLSVLEGRRLVRIADRIGSATRLRGQALMREVLFDQMKLPIQKRTGTTGDGYAWTSSQVPVAGPRIDIHETHRKPAEK